MILPQRYKIHCYKSIAIIENLRNWYYIGIKISFVQARLLGIVSSVFSNRYFNFSESIRIVAIMSTKLDEEKTFRIYLTFTFEVQKNSCTIKLN